MKRARFMPAGLLAISADSWGVEFDVVAAPREPFEAAGDFAVVAICGPLTQREAFFWDSYEAISARVQAALESHLPALLLRISSPGGQVAGCFELAEEIRTKAAAAGKRVVAYVDGIAASAAYALACAADAIYVPATGIVGSIGCMQVAVDATAADRAMGLGFEVFTSGTRKADGNPHVPMSDAARAAIKTSVDDMATTFFDVVARRRGLKREAVAALEAGVFVGAKGVAVGLADDVRTFAEVVASGGKTIAQQEQGAEVDMDEKEKAIAALRALAESKDDAESKQAKSALKALGVAAEGEDGDEKKDDEKKSDDAGATKAEGESGDEKKKDDDEAKAKASAASSGTSASSAAVPITSMVEKIVEAKLQSVRDDAERDRLLEGRKDISEKLRASLKSEPLAMVRKILDGIEVGPKKNAAADVTPAATRAAAHVDGGTITSQSSPEITAVLDQRMGFARREAAVKHEGCHSIFPALTAEDARRMLAAKNTHGGK